MFKTHFWRTVIFGIIGLLIGLTMALLSPKTYEANAELLIGERQLSGTASILDPTVQRILEQGTAADTQTELQLLRSQTVFFNAYRNAITARNSDKIDDWIDYYRKYDVASVEQRTNTVDQGGVALIRVKAYDPQLAEDIADQITRVHNELRVQNARSSAANAVRYLSAQVQAAKTTLDAAEKAYKDFTNSTNIVDIGVSVQAAQGQYNTMLATYNQLQQQADGAQQEVAVLQARVNSEPDFVQGASFESRPTRVANLEVRLAELRSQLEGLRTRYYDDHPRVKDLAEQVRKTESELKAEKAKGTMEASQDGRQRNGVKEQLKAQLATIEARRDSLVAQVNEAKSQVDELQGKLNVLPGQESQLRQLRRDLDVADQNYRRVKTQFDDLNNRKEVATRGNTVLSEARAFINPVAPDTSKFVFVGFIAGLIVGLLFSFALESLRLRVHNSAQLAEITGLPVAATIPRLKRQALTVSALASPGAKPAESFKHMAYTMLAGNNERGVPKMVMFTGVGNVSGRASSALQFAMAMAASGTRVLIVDTDPIRGLITKAFGAEGKSGVSEIFERTTLPADGADLILPTVHDNLLVLPTGADLTRTLADRTNAQVAAFIKFLADKADLIVFDLPPCDMYSDASRLAGLVDEVCMVVSATSTNYQQIPSGYDILHRAGAKHVSLVMTDASPQDEPFADQRRYGRTA